MIAVRGTVRTSAGAPVATCRLANMPGSSLWSGLANSARTSNVARILADARVDRRDLAAEGLAGKRVERHVGRLTDRQGAQAIARATGNRRRSDRVPAALRCLCRQRGIARCRFCGCRGARRKGAAIAFCAMIARVRSTVAAADIARRDARCRLAPWPCCRPPRASAGAPATTSMFFNCARPLFKSACSTKSSICSSGAPATTSSPDLK